MKRLIINADDYGLDPGVDRGIAEAIASGAVTSTSCIVYGEPPQIPAELAGRVGVHLRLTDGAPVSDPATIPTLVNAEGRFPNSRAAVAARRVNPYEVAREWRAQIALFLETGIRPTHFDTHHHSHGLSGVAGVYLSLAAECGVAGVPMGEANVERLSFLGIPHADHCEVGWNVFDVRESLLDVVGRAFASGRQTVHLMTHPGYVCPSLIGRTSMVESRAAELATLTSAAFRQALADDGIELCGMRDL